MPAQGLHSIPTPNATASDVELLTAVTTQFSSNPATATVHLELKNIAVEELLREVEVGLWQRLQIKFLLGTSSDSANSASARCAPAAWRTADGQPT